MTQPGGRRRDRAHIPLSQSVVRPVRPLVPIGSAVLVVLGWGVAQWPYMLPTSLKVSQAAAPDPTLTSIFVVFVIAVIVIVPSLGLLYYLDQRNLLEPEETVAAS